MLWHGLLPCSQPLFALGPGDWDLSVLAWGTAHTDSLPCPPWGQGSARQGAGLAAARGGCSGNTCLSPSLALNLWPVQM